MTPSHAEPRKSKRIRAAALASISWLALLLIPNADAQTQDAAKFADVHSSVEKPTTQSYKTFYLSNITRDQDANEIQTDLRNMIPNAKLVYVPSQNALSIRGSDEDLALAQRILTDLDRARKAYRLTYTITETENGQPSGRRNVAMVVTSNGKSEVKQGSKVPLVIGTNSKPNEPQYSDVQYQDVGLQIEATLNGYADGIHLRSRIAESSVSDEKSGMGGQDPIFRQTTLDGTATLVPGKPLVIGSLDLPGTNRREQVEVVAEAVP